MHPASLLMATLMGNMRCIFHNYVTGEKNHLATGLQFEHALPLPFRIKNASLKPATETSGQLLAGLSNGESLAVTPPSEKSHVCHRPILIPTRLNTGPQTLDVSIQGVPEALQGPGVGGEKKTVKRSRTAGKASFLLCCGIRQERCLKQ